MPVGSPKSGVSGLWSWSTVATCAMSRRGAAWDCQIFASEASSWTMMLKWPASRLSGARHGVARVRRKGSAAGRRRQR